MLELDEDVQQELRDEWGELEFFYQKIINCDNAVLTIRVCNKD